MMAGKDRGGDFGMGREKDSQNKDVFEYIPDEKTTKEPEIHQWAGTAVPHKDDIDVSKLLPEKAFETFKGKSYSVAPFDRGFPIGSFLRTQARQDYELLGGSRLSSNCDRSKLKQFETPTQRLSRLQNEVQDFLEFLNTQKQREESNVGICGSGGPKDLLEDLDPAAVGAELQVLERQIEALLDDPRLKDEIPELHPSVAQRTLPVSLTNQMNTIIEQKRTDSPEGDKGKAAKEAITYELYCSPSNRGLLSAAALTVLENRVADVERQIGWAANAQLPFPDLHTAVSDVSERLNILDANKLDAIGRRIQAVMGELDVAIKRKSEFLAAASITVENEKCINEMYDMFQKWRHATHVLPSVMERLASLQTVHKHSASFSDRLTALEAQQAELATLLESTSAAVATARSASAENCKIMKTNVEDIEKRVSKLSQHISKS